MQTTLAPQAFTIADLKRDPYPIYAGLRREAPIAPIPAANVWFAIRWADVETIVKSAGKFTAEAVDSPVERSFGSPTILTSEGSVLMELRGGLEIQYRAREVQTYIERLARPMAEQALSGFCQTNRTLVRYPLNRQCRWESSASLCRTFADPILNKERALAIKIAA